MPRVIPSKLPKSPRIEYWNLYRDGVTQGALNLFLTCREQFRLRYLEGWVRKGTSEALDFGTLFHGCLESIAACPEPQSISGHEIQLQKALLEYGRMLKRNSASYTEAELLTQQRLSRIAEVLGAQYIQTWFEEDQQRSWIAREDTFRVSVTVPKTCIASGMQVMQEVPLRGRWDGVFSKKSINCLLETKTKANIDEEGLQATLPFDLQTMLYCYTSQVVHGKPIGEIIYDVIRRPGQRWTQDDTMSSYIARVQEDVITRPKHYLKRWRVVLSKGDINRWFEHQLQPLLRELCEWYDSITSPEYLDNPWKSPHHYMNPNALFSRWGRCDMFHLITAKQTFNLRRLSPGEPFPELVDE